MLTAVQLEAVDAFTVAEGIPVEADVSLERYSYFTSCGSLPYKDIDDTSNIMFLDDRL